MQPTLPAPPFPLFGVLTFGFVYIAIYVLIRLSKEGQERFQACKRTMLVGMLVMIVVAWFESLNYWNWLIQNPQAYQGPVFFVAMLFGLQFVILICIDLGIQWFLLRR
jgi:hypothetical protein